MNSNPQLNEVLTAMEDISQASSPRKISYDKIKTWMKADDIEILGAVVYFITDRRYYPYIEPPLAFSDYHGFMLNYYRRCFIENPRGEWSDSRYSAGRSLVSWFKGLWDDPEAPRSALSELREFMGELYKQEDEDVRDCLITATLEHLLSNRKIAKFFSVWIKDPVLDKAYQEALSLCRISIDRT